jgi:hypothetical protein
MNDQPTATEERRAALDKFAEAPPTQPGNGSVMAIHNAAERVFGAQRVAVYRDESRIFVKLQALGAAAGDDWFYRFPAGSKGGVKQWIEGPSIKLANDLARIYGNCEVDTRVTDVGDSWLIYARFTDYETGFAMTRPFQQRKSQKTFKGDEDRARDIALQIGVSKAIRNVVTNALQTYADYAFEAARDSLVEKIGSKIESYRTRVLEGLAKIPVELVRVEKVVGRTSKDWLAPDIARVIAMMKAIADGMATVDETFPASDDAAANTSSATTAQDASPPATSEAGQGPAPETDRSASQASQSNEGAGAAADTKTMDKPTTDASAGIKPDSETSYVAYANAKIAAITDAAEGRKWWGSEKSLRNKCNVTAEVRDGLKADLDAKCSALEKE